MLERAYAKLPKEFDGAKRSLVSPVGGSRRGVMRTADFFEKTVGKRDGVLSKYEWLNIPESCLLEAVNGKIFEDNFGEVTKIRQRLAFYPDDIARKKLASALIICGQAGQYNFSPLYLPRRAGGGSACGFRIRKRRFKRDFPA